MSKTIVVVGATGNQGSSVVKTFSKLPGWKVRGITRNVDSTAAQELKTVGIEMVSANLDSLPSLISAFSGAHAVFGVTDFWQFAQDPSTAAAAKERAVRPNVICLERELEQFKNIIHAAAEVLAAERQLERLVLSTLSYSAKLSNGAITHNLHFDGKAMGVEYLQTSTDPKLVALAERTSYVQIGHYLDNWKKGFGMGPKQLEDGSIIYQTADEPPSTSEYPMVHPPTDTGPFVEALVLRNPAGTTMLGTSQMISLSDYAKLLATHFQQPVTMSYTSKEEIFKKAGPDFGLEIIQSGKYVSKFGWDGGAADVKKPWELGVDMSALMTPAEYIKETDWSSMYYSPGKA